MSSINTRFSLLTAAILPVVASLMSGPVESKADRQRRLKRERDARYRANKRTKAVVA